MYAVNLKVNHLTNPIGIDADGFFLSRTCAGGIRQMVTCGSYVFGRGEEINAGI